MDQSRSRSTERATAMDAANGAVSAAGGDAG